MIKMHSSVMHDELEQTTMAITVKVQPFFK